MKLGDDVSDSTRRSLLYRVPVSPSSKIRLHSRRVSERPNYSSKTEPVPETQETLREEGKGTILSHTTKLDHDSTSVRTHPETQLIGSPGRKGYQPKRREKG